jgi:hypothetical protein
LVVCLLLTDLIQGVSGIVTLKWLADGGISTGTLCTVQAVMFHVADVGTALWNTAIAGHTFWTVVLGKTSAWSLLFTHVFDYRKAIVNLGYHMRDWSRLDDMFHSP